MFKVKKRMACGLLLTFLSCTLDGDTLRFVLAGSPVGDPGLTFQRL